MKFQTSLHINMYACQLNCIQMETVPKMWRMMMNARKMPDCLDR